MLHLLLFGHCHGLALKLEVGLDARGGEPTHVEVLEPLPIGDLNVRLRSARVPAFPNVLVSGHILQHKLIHACRETQQSQGYAHCED